MGRKTVHFRRSSQAEFARQFTRLCNTKRSWEVWADFVTMSAISIANAFDQQGKTHDEREKEYLNLISHYTKAEQRIFPELFAKLVEGLEEDPAQDFLGEIFMVLDLANHWKGQVFTSYPVCKLMAAITIEDRVLRIQNRGWDSICDPCCGAGVLLIAARNEMIKRGLGPRQMLYVAQDIDRTAALMCYLQLSLLGCAGYVIVGDSLSQPLAGPTESPLLFVPTREHWLMPALYDEVWVCRIQCERARQYAKK